MALPAAAALVIPVADTLEVDGSFVNAAGLTQSFRRVLPPPVGVEPAWRAVQELAAALGKDLGFKDLDGLRKGLSDAAEAAQ